MNKDMKTIKAIGMNNNSCMVYEVNGVEYNVTGEFYYNAKKGRYEHIHIGKRGGEYLVIFKA